MNVAKRYAAFAILLVLSIALIILGWSGIADDFWGSMGFALLAVSIVRLLRLRRFQKDEVYREKIEIEAADERNHFIRGRAWAWAGYLFVMVGSVLVIVFRAMGQDLLSTAVSMAVCFMLVAYWGAYIILKRKY